MFVSCFPHPHNRWVHGNRPKPRSLSSDLNRKCLVGDLFVYAGIVSLNLHEDPSVIMHISVRYRLK